MVRTSNKIRINELARELEVKAGTIIDLLPELGVDEKKTHSSSIDDATAKKLRERLHGAEESAPEPLPELELPAPRRAAPPAPASVTPKPPVRPSISVGRGGPIKPPVLRPPLVRAAQPAAEEVKPKPVAPPKPIARAKPAAPAAPATPAAPLAPVTPSAPPAMPAAPQPKPDIPMIPRRSPEQSAPTIRRAVPAPPQRPSPGAAAPRPSRPAGFPGAPQQRPQRPQRPPQAPQQQMHRGAPSAPGRQPASPGPRPGRPAGPGAMQPSAAPGAPQARSAPSIVPGQPIYQRPRPGGAGGPVPGMPTGGRPGAPARPGAPGPGGAPGRPPAPGRGRPRPGARRRDPEAEREQKLLRGSQTRAPQAPPKAVNTEIVIGDGATVKELAEKLGIKANLIIKTLFERGLFATINQTLTMEMIKDLSGYFGATVEELTFEEEASMETDLAEDSSQLEPRAPVVTVMGHVDHGKTSLLDAIRKTSVAEREAGGITQAIGASTVVLESGKKIVFVDTPGHEAFTRMRAHGAAVTDVVILVVAADDGVMPQTLEAIDHARAAKVPIVVAVNKIDKNNAQPDRVKQQLSDRGLMPEEWGGETIMSPVSAITGEGIEQLLDTVLLVAEMRELKANPNRLATGTVLEAKLDRGQGPVATVIIQNGTLHVGDYFLVGSVFGRVRALLGDRGEQVKEAGPASAVVVLGLDSLPQPGDQLHVTTDIDKARKIVGHREEKERDQHLAKSSRLSLEQFQDMLKRGEVKELPIVLKADVQGSLDVLEDTIRKLKNDKVEVQLIHTGVGAISESDVLLAMTADAIIVGFNVRPERSATALAEKEKIDVRLHTVIYELHDELKKGLAGLLDPVIKETFEGRAKVQEIFHVSKVGTVAGCIIDEGKASKTSHARLLRDNVVVHTGKLASLKRFKDDVNEVRAGQDCGIRLESYNDVKQGDVIELFQTEKVAQELVL